MSFSKFSLTENLFFASWTAVTAFQTTTAIIDAWKWWKKIRRPTTYERVIKGESLRGWEVAIPADKFRKNYHQSVRVANTEDFVTCRLWTDDLDDQSDLMTPPSSSLIFCCRNPSPKGYFWWKGYAHRIRQVSLIQPNATVTLLKIVCPNGWNLKSCHHLTSRNLMVVFKSVISFSHRIVLLDTYRNEYRSFVIKAPEAGPEADSLISLAYLEKKSTLRLRVLWKALMPEEGEWRLEFTNAVYEIPDNKDIEKKIDPLTWEWISFPVGNQDGTYWYNFNSGIPIAAVTRHWDSQNMDDMFCFTYDHKKNWKWQSLTQWLADFRKSTTGNRILNAGKSFLQLSPPELKWPFGMGIDVDSLKEFDPIFTLPKSDSLFAMTDYDGILKRRIRTPTLLMTAAEILFKANPDLKMSQVKDAKGIDLSDGIPDEDKEECETLFLSDLQ